MVRLPMARVPMARVPMASDAGRASPPVTAAVLAVVFSAAAACTSSGDAEGYAEAERSGYAGRLVLSGTKPGVRLDPHMDAQWEVLYILSAVYDTLVSQSADGALVPGLARAWRIDDGGRRYTFDLRDDVTFHDGTRFDAEAVKFNIERILSLGSRSLKARALLPDFESIDVVGEYSIRFELERPDNYFLFWLSMPYLAMVSPKAVRTWGEQYHHHQSGTGPFMFSEYVVGDRYTLRRNPRSDWAPATQVEGGPALLEEIVWRFLPEPSTRAPALEAGDVDIAFDLLPTDAEHLARSRGHTVSSAYLSGQPAFWFLNTTLPPTDDIRVRKALLFAADMQAAVESIMRGFNPVAHGPLSAVTPEYAPEVENLYTHDPERARALLAQAGWVDRDGDGVREKDGRDLLIRMSMVSWGKSRFFSELLYSQLRAVGVELQLEMMDYSVQMEYGRDGSKNMLFMGGSGHSASDSLKGYFHSANADSGFAWSKYRDSTLDALLDEAVLTQDIELRADLYRRAQRLIMSQALILPIYDYVLLIGASKRVGGLSWGNTGLIPNYRELHVDEPSVRH